jgi:GT2 family glycosyltransferase
MTSTRVAVVILNTNKRADTLACLDSLSRSTWPQSQLDIVVLDNGSTDGSIDAIRRAHPAVMVSALSENRGYAGNNNVGIALATARGADWIFVVNEDTIVDPDCVERMVRYGEQHPLVGMVGPLVFHFDEPTCIQSAGGWFDAHWQAGHIGQNEEDRGQFVDLGPRRVDWISGCGLMVRRSVIEQIGAIDERFFYYWEETEWCLRARRAGWELVIVPEARLWHKGVTRRYEPTPNVSYYHTRNRLLLMRKHGAPTSRMAIEVLRSLRTLASWSVRPKWRHLRDRRAHRRAVAEGLRDFARQRWGQRAVGIVFLSAGLCLSASGRAAAQTQTADPSDTALQHLGPFAFNPGFVFSTGYDTNAYREAGSKPNVETYAVPQIDGWVNIGRLRSNLFGAIELVRFAHSNGARNHQYGARNEWQGARLMPYIDFSSKHTNANPTGFEVGRKSMRIENDTKAGLRTALGARVIASAFYRLTKTNWDADAVYQTSSLREKLNRTDKAIGVTMEVALTPLTTVRFVGDTNKSEFVFSPIRNGSGYRFGPGVTIRGPAAIVGNAEVAVRSFRSDTSGVNFKGIVSDVMLSRAFPSGTFVAFRFDRDLQFSYDPSLKYFIARSIELALIQALGEQFAVQAFVARHNLTYNVADPGSVPVSDVNEYGVAIGRRIGRVLRVGMSAESASAGGNQPWTERRITAFLTYGFGGFQRLDRPIPFQR